MSRHRRTQDGADSTDRRLAPAPPPDSTGATASGREYRLSHYLPIRHTFSIVVRSGDDRGGQPPILWRCIHIWYSCLGSPVFKHHYDHHYPFEWPYEISTSLEVCSAIQQRTSKITSEVVKPTYPEPG